jgi:hypothetical protein
VARKKPVMPESDDDPVVQRHLRRLSEEREYKAHAVAAALDECLTLLMLALAQAAETPRGMQARRARRLLNKFQTLRANALDGVSPCSQRKVVETLVETLEHTDRLVR